MTVIDQNGNRIVITPIGNGKYTFSMPDGPVTVSATFIEAEPTGLPFLDVRLSDWFCEYVRYVYENGLMVGTSSDAFSPNTTTSRGMLVTILYRLEDSPAAANTYFSDVPLNQYYAQAASWAAENSIATGYGDGRYGPDDPITREQIVAILMNYAQFKGMDTNVQSNLTQFSDRDLIDDYAWDAMVWANAVGVINGKGGGILDPDGPATRAEVATILTKFCPMIEEY